MIPIPAGVRRVVSETYAEDEAKRYREDADAKLKRLQDTPMAKLGPDTPLPDVPLKRPPWMGSRGYDTPDKEQPSPYFGEGIAPGEDDQARNYDGLGAPLSFGQDFSQPLVPEQEAAPGIGFGAGGPEGGPLSEATIVDLKKRREAQSAGALREALVQQPGSPDDAAKDLDLAEQLGVNRGEVSANRKSYEFSKTARDLDALKTTAPRLRSWMDEARENLEIAHDDIDHLGWWEQTQNTLGQIGGGVGGALASGYLKISEGAYGVARAPFEINDQFVSWVTGKKQESDPAKFFAGMQAQAKAQSDALMPETDDPTARGVLSGFQSIPASAMAAVVGVMSGGAAPALAVMGGVTGGSEYGRAREQGMEASAALGYGTGQGLIEVATEALPMTWLIGDIAKRTPFFEMLTKQALGEGVTEQVATHSQDFLSWAVLPENEGKPISAYIADRGPAAYETLLAALVGSGVQTTLAKSADMTLQAVSEGAQARRANDLAKTFDAMAQGAKDSKLLKRLPEKYRAAVASVTQDGPLESVRVTPEAFTELAQSANVTPEQLAQAFRIDPADMNGAINAGEDVVIPAGNYAAALQTAKKEIGVSGETIHSAFAPNMRLRADDFTAKEREAMKAVFEEEQAARAEAGKTEQGFADSADRVREAIREQVTGLKIFNTEAANAQAAIIGEMVTTLAERTGQDPEALWKEQGFDVAAVLSGEEPDVNELAQSFEREAMPVSDEEILQASETLEPRELEAWKSARKGLSNERVAEEMNAAEPDAIVSPAAVSAYLTQARAKGFAVGRAKAPSNPKGRPETAETTRVIQMLAEGASREAIANEVYPDRERAKALNLIRQFAHKHKDRIAQMAAQPADALAQSKRGTFSPRADRSIIRLFESSNLSTLAHEGAHWYLDTLWRMAQTENPHPFVLEQLAAVLEWQGKSPNWTAMFNPDGTFTAEGRDVQEAFAESFEAYLREGKAPTSALRSVFATFKAWLVRIYKSLSQIGGRVRLNDEIRQVFDRMLATEEAIKAVHTGMARDGKAMAEAIIEKTGKDWTDERKAKFTERMTERYAKAREQAEAELMARLMDEYERSQKSWWRDEERQVRREVQSEVDERPEQRAYAWLSGKGWKDTREAHVEASGDEAEAMLTLAQADGYAGSSVVEAVEWISARRQGLDLSDAARKARATEQGFTTKVFHETRSSVDALTGGFDLTRRLASAGDYVMPIGVFTKPGAGGIGIGETQVPLLVRIGNTRTFADRAELEAYLRQDAEYAELADAAVAASGNQQAELKSAERAWREAERGSREWYQLNDEINRLLRAQESAGNSAAEAARVRATDVLRQQGLNSITVAKDDGLDGASRKVKAIIILDPKDIRSPDAAFNPQEADSARLLAQADGYPALIDRRYVDLSATTENLRELQTRMINDGVVPIILLFKTDSGRVIALPGTDGMNHDLARDVLGLGDLKLQHGVWNPRKWPTLAAMNEAGEHAWYSTSGKEADSESSLAQTLRPLPMDEASRMGRAREQGFDVDTPLYHGSPNGNIQEMNRGTGYLGDGVYLTQDRKIASGYKTQSGNERGASPLTRAARSITGKVYETYVRGKGIGAEEYQNLVNKLNLEAANGNIFAADPSQTRAKMMAQSQLAEQGITHVVDGDLVMVFNPKNVRSTDATFDPAESGSSKLLAQSGGANDRTAPPPSLPPMRLNLQAVKEEYGEDALAGLPPEVAAYSAQATDVEQFLQIALDVRKTLKRKEPKDDPAAMVEYQSAQAWEAWFDRSGIDISKPVAEIRAQLEIALTGQAENAIGPNEAAPFFQMQDGKALLEGLKQGPKRNQIIREETKRRMIARHGDILRDGTLMQEAQVYARNEVQGRQFEIELDALARAAGQPTASNLAKQTAIENLQSKQVREVLNYDQWRILSDRWGKKALEAASKGKLDQAAEYARYRLINHHMFIEGRKLADKVEKTRKTLVAYGTKPRQQRLFAAGKEYAENMNSLLDDYQLRNETKAGENKRVRRAAWIKAQLTAIDPYSAYYDAAKSPEEQQVAAAEAIERSDAVSKLGTMSEAKNYKSLTLEEFDAVDAEASMIWKMATMADQLIKGAKRKRLTLAAEDIAATIITNHPKEKKPDGRETDVPGEKRKRGLSAYWSMHRTLQALARDMDGGKDGGTVTSYLVRPLNEGFSRLVGLKKQAGEDLKRLFSVYTAAEQKRWFSDRVHFASIGESLTKQGRLAVALNWGNATNRKRLLDSTGWTEAQVQEILNTLEERDFKFIQSIGDYLDTYFAEANRVHENIHASPMLKVDPAPIATRFGIFPGFYFPIRFDPFLSSTSAQRQLEKDAPAAQGRVGVRTEIGSAKKRVEGKVTLPLKLSVLDVLVGHLDEVTTSIATEEALFDVGRLVKRKEVEDAIVSRYGRATYNEIINVLKSAKFGLDSPKNVFEHFINHVRNGATVVGLGWKVATAALQPLGVTNSIVRVGGYWMMRGYARMGVDPWSITKAAKFAFARSDFMRHRMQSNSPELTALRGTIKPGVPGVEALRQSSFWLMSSVQFVSVDLATWLGQFEKSQASGKSEADAAAEADQAVIDAQGGGELHQIAGTQRGSPLTRLFSNFASYMLTTLNLATNRVRGTKNPVQAMMLALDMALLLSVPVAAKMALDAWTKGGDDDEEDLWEKYARQQTAFLIGPFLGINQFGSQLQNGDYGYRSPAGLGFFTEAAKPFGAASDAVFDALAGREVQISESDIRGAGRAAGILFHLPEAQIDATIRGALSMWKGEETDPKVLLFGPPPK